MRMPWLGRRDAGRRPEGGARRRRAVVALEIALTFPLYLLVFFGILEYSWYYFQRTLAAEAVRAGCQEAGQNDPNTANFLVAGAQRTQEIIEDRLNITCNDGTYSCTSTFPLVAANLTPPRLVCDFTFTYVPLTGLLSPGGGGSGVRLLPENITVRSATIFERSEP